MAISEARKKANKKWNDKNMKERYDRVQLIVPKGQREVIKAFAKSQGKSLNNWVYELICKEMSANEVRGRTNYEHIKNMSIEEIAETFVYCAPDTDDDYQLGWFGLNWEYKRTEKEAIEDNMEWLESEAEIWQ